MLQPRAESRSPFWRMGSKRLRAETCELQKLTSAIAVPNVSAHPNALHAIRDRPALRRSRLGLNHRGLSGAWEVRAESGLLREAHGRISLRFHSRDAHLVLGPAESGNTVPFHVTLEGASPGSDAGTDCASDGSGKVREPRLYQLIRQKGRVEDRTFGIEIFDSGVRAFSFTFG